MNSALPTKGDRGLVITPFTEEKNWDVEGYNCLQCHSRKRFRWTLNLGRGCFIYFFEVILVGA